MTTKFSTLQVYAFEDGSKMEDGILVHTKIELVPLNKDYDVIELDEDTEYRTIGILKCVLSN